MHKKRHPFILVLNILIFSLTLLCYYTDTFSLSIKGVAPLIVLPLIIAFSFFHSPIRSALTGLICGIVMDSCAAGSYCFNAILLLLIAAFISVASSNLFNKNIQSAAVLSLMVSVFYFILLWIRFHAIGVSLTDSLIYLLKYAFPSAVFSAVFIFPLYYIYKHFYKLTLE